MHSNLGTRPVSPLSVDEAHMVKVRDEDCIQSFGVLFSKWQTPISRLCYRMTGRWEDAEDLTQDVFAKLYRSRNNYRTTAKFSTYIWRIAVNRCRDFDRQKKRRKKLKQSFDREIERLHPSQASTHARDMEEAVRAAVLDLQANYRTVVVLRHYEQMKFHEIAELLSIPAGTVASRMAQALRLIEASLKESEFCKPSK